MATLDFVNTLGIRRPDSQDNKYSRGVVGFITGSDAFPGSALLSVGAALILGIGMVRYLGPKSVALQVIQKYPETVLVGGRMDCLAIGSGLDKPLTESELQLLESAPTSVIDAHALQIVDFARTPLASILTPHFGEFQRLRSRLGLAELAENDGRDQESFELQSAVSEVAKLSNRFVLLKGSITYLAAPSGGVQAIGPQSAWLATAGSGDILTGILGALLAANFSELKDSPDRVLQIAELAIKMHSRAAEIAAEVAPVSASTILSNLGEAALEFLV